MDKYRVEIIAHVEASSPEHAEDQVRWSASKLHYPTYVGQARLITQGYLNKPVEAKHEIES